MCPHAFKHEYLSDQWADLNQILPEASLGKGIGFGPDRIGILVSIFDRIVLILAGYEDIYNISYNFEIRQDRTKDCGVRCP